MKVLILGSKGLLGQAVMKTWQHSEIIGLDQPEIDITSQRQIVGALEKYQPTILINCAAFTDVDRCEEEEERAKLINGEAVGYLASACKERRLPIVHISTDYVFNGHNKRGYQEIEQLSPINAYGRSKAVGEEILQNNTDMFYLIRTAWLFGPGGKNFVRTIIEYAHLKPSLMIVNDQHGQPTYTYDLATFIKSLIIEKAPFGIYHGVNEGPTTWFSFAREILKQAHIRTTIKPCRTSDYPRPANRPTWSILLNTKRPHLRPWASALNDYLKQEGVLEI